MKLARVLWRIAILLLAAAALVGLTRMYGNSLQYPLPSPRAREARLHQPSLPEDAGAFSEVLGGGVVVAVCALAGRIVFRLRLNPPPRNSDKLVSLGLAKDGTDS